ncbi:AraC family transcriptional regulator [Planctobacterium marinum]|uniref:AraC family transcriptional regulator n=1 Tax=Planctobacterium marinum TaxID=1631968 RepID=A0AA48HPB7_9ALTE|nr:AraC family transcriptional regulator [Planctobacterium marinum]
MLDYIETNLDSDIEIAVMAERASASLYHFHRVFSGAFGLTPAEYVRCRRLTMAGEELKNSKQTVLAIAAKYGFDSPNAFTRAFRQFHGVNPNQARNEEFVAADFNRHQIDLPPQGEITMQYQLINKPAFKALGKSQAFEFESFAKKAPKYWKDYVAGEEYSDLMTLSQGQTGTVSQAPLMSVYQPDESGNRQQFTDTLAIEADANTAPDKFNLIEIPAATYAEFHCTWHTSMQTNKAIYGKWFAESGFERDGSKPDIAAYFPVPFRPLKEMKIRWWIPVLVKSD